MFGEHLFNHSIHISIPPEGCHTEGCYPVPVNADEVDEGLNLIRLEPTTEDVHPDVQQLLIRVLKIHDNNGWREVDVNCSP